MVGWFVDWYCRLVCVAYDWLCGVMIWCYLYLLIGDLIVCALLMGGDCFA